MKAFEFRPFIKEDFPEAPWLEKLIRPLNTVLGQVRSGLANGLSLGDNLNAEVKVVDVTPPEEWVALSLENSWVASSGSAVPAYRKDHLGTVYFRGAVTGGVFSTSLRLAQVATGYRPDYAQSRIIESHASGGSHFPAYIEIASDGSVYPHAGTASTDLELNGLLYISGGSLLVPAGNTLVSFKSKVKGAAGVVVLRALQLSGRDQIPVSGVGGCNWAQSGENITIQSVTGLATGSTYRVTFVIFGG